MEKNIEYQSKGLKCDNPSCDWKDETIQVEGIEAYINKPCPKCGENVLTFEDYQNLIAVLMAADFINSLSPEQLTDMANTIGGDEEHHDNTLRLFNVETHKGIKITEATNEQTKD